MKKFLSLCLTLVMLLSLTFSFTQNLVLAEEAEDEEAADEEVDEEVADEEDEAADIEAADDESADEEDEETADAEDEVADEEDEAAGDTYTYHEAWGGTPKNWNPHTWEDSGDGEMLAYVTTTFMGRTIAEDGYNWTFWHDGIEEETKDITADFADKEKWGIDPDADKGYVYQVKLSPGLEWEDGTPIDAHDFVWSMQQLLRSDMKNNRAEMWIAADHELVGAADYFNGDRAGQTRYTNIEMDEETEEYTTPVDDGDYLVNLAEDNYFFGGPATATHEDERLAELFLVNDEDMYEKYSEEWTVVDEEVRADLEALAENFNNPPEAWVEFCNYEDGVYPEADPENIGIYAVDDHTFNMVFVRPDSDFYRFPVISGGWLVYPDLYEKNQKKTGDLVTTSYGTDLDTTMSWGPYKLTSFEKDKQFIFERNENWIGYKDGKEEHEGIYQADRVVVDVVPEAATRLQLFNQGKLDYVGLQSEDLDKYRFSDYLLLAELDYTPRFIFATSLESLAALEEEQGAGNKRILHYPEFRKAISLSIDRAKFCKEATPGYKPAFALMGNLYYYDIENDPNSLYRESEPAKEIICRLYGMEYGEGKDFETLDEAHEAVTGYDVEEAKQLFTAAYEQAIEDGNYEDGQDIVIRCMATSAETLSADQTKQQDMLNEFVAEATEGTPLEGKINFEFLAGSKTMYEDVAAGKIEMITGAWGGAVFYPFKAIGCYVAPEYVGGLEHIHESNGWDPTKETATIVWDFDGDGEEEEDTHSLTEWHSIINDPTHPYYENIDNRLKIMAELEYNVLSAYQCIPWGTVTNAAMRSMKIEFATYEFNVMYDYGGLRLMTFNYSDAEWAEFVDSQGGTLNYE